jgi:LAO/AO transport system kinase
MTKKNTENAKNRAISRFLKNSSETLSVDALVTGIRGGNKQVLAKAITLLESTRPEHSHMATEVVRQCLPLSGNSIRIGITGVPGVGKSTFIEAFGNYLTTEGFSVAVLAIDPSSNVNKGSILGDKTRMEKLSVNPKSFIRPSPSSGTLGGVANATRESIILCEAAGFDVIIIETVGVGQSEYLVKEMVDLFLLLMLAGAGDEIQGIKRGIMEMADILVVNKADGENEAFARKAASNYKNALHLFPAREDQWIPVVTTCSSTEIMGISEIWSMVNSFKTQQTTNGWFAHRRTQQSETWLMEQVSMGLKKMFFENPEVSKNLNSISDQVIGNQITPYVGAQKLLQKFANSFSKKD